MNEPLTKDKRHYALDCTCKAEYHFAEENVLSAVRLLREKMIRMKCIKGTKTHKTSNTDCYIKYVDMRKIIDEVFGKCEK